MRRGQKKSIRKLQLFGCAEKNFHAGAKAPQDAMRIAESMGFRTMRMIFRVTSYADTGKRGASNAPVPLRRVVKRLYKIFKKIFGKLERAVKLPPLFFKTKRSDILFVQYPDWSSSARILHFAKKANPRLFIIALVHDADAFRTADEKKSKLDFLFSDFAPIPDVLIVHNQKMVALLESHYQIPREKMIPLEIFDYLIPGFAPVRAEFRRSLVVAGNLDTKKKSPYIALLKNVRGQDFVLYGVNYREADTAAPNIEYRGAFPPEALPRELDGGFGLVWDGDSVDTCSGATGEYLRWNNPHKLSLYLACAMPVVIWEEAAEADFVRANKVGLSVASLYDARDKIQKMSASEYAELSRNALALSEKIRAGYFLKTALGGALGKAKRERFEKS